MPDGLGALIKSSVLLFTLASGCAAKNQPDEFYIPPTTPPDVAALLRKGDFKTVSELGMATLKNSLGSSFPKIEGRWRGRVVTIPDKYRGKKAAVLLAGGPCSLTLDWLDWLGKEGWIMDGYDVLVVLTLTDEPDEVTTRIPPGVEKYEVDFPLPGYLGYAYWYPTMYYVNADGVFEGYQDGPGSFRHLWNGETPGGED